MAGGIYWQFVAFFFFLIRQEEVQQSTLFPVQLPALSAGCLLFVFSGCEVVSFGIAFGLVVSGLPGR